MTRGVRLDVPIELAHELRALSGQWVEYDDAVWLIVRVEPPGPMDTRSRDPATWAGRAGEGIVVLRRPRDESAAGKPIRVIDPRTPLRVLPWPE